MTRPATPTMGCLMTVGCAVNTAAVGASSGVLKGATLALIEARR